MNILNEIKRNGWWYATWTATFYVLQALNQFFNTLN